MKTNNEDHIEGLFRDKVKDWAPEPPKGLWKAIQAQQQRRRRILIYKKIAAAATLLLLISLPFVINRQTNEPQMPHQVVQQVVASESKSHPLVDTFDDKQINSDFAVTEKHPLAVVYQPTDKARTKPAKDDFSPTPTVNLMMVETSELETAANSQEIAKADDSNEQAKQAVEEMLIKLKEEGSEPATVASANLNKGSSFAIVYNVPPTAIKGENGLFSNILNYRYGPDPFQGNMALETSYFKDIQESRLEAPFSAGLRVAFPVTQRLAFETGLVYTQLNTYTKTFPLDGVYLEYNQTLIYLGIPLGMRYDLLQSRTFNLYLGQHVMAEKGITAINSVNKFDKDRNIGKKKLYENIHGFQLSTTSALGAGIALHHYVSFYAEGGLQIFYLNHSQPFNIRSSKRLWPVYQTGLRVNF